MRELPKKGLGKGLEALFAQEYSRHYEDESNITVHMIKTIDIEPSSDQPRKSFSQIEELADSIKANGVIQPIIVQKTEKGTFKIIAGERRWRASKLADLKEIPCIIKEYADDKRMEIMLIENLQREDLNPIEEAYGYKLLCERYNIKHEEIAERVGKSRSAITNAMRLLDLPDEVLEYIKEGKISAGHGRAILSAFGAENHVKLANAVIESELSVRELEELVKESDRKKKKKVVTQAERELAANLMAIADKLSSSLGAKVTLLGGKNKSKVQIECQNSEELDRIINILMK